jgi:hypothetical protein
MCLQHTTQSPHVDEFEDNAIVPQLALPSQNMNLPPLTAPPVDFPAQYMRIPAPPGAYVAIGLPNPAPRLAEPAPTEDTLGTAQASAVEHLPPLPPDVNHKQYNRIIARRQCRIKLQAQRALQGIIDGPQVRRIEALALALSLDPPLSHAAFVEPCCTATYSMMREKSLPLCVALLDEARVTPRACPAQTTRPTWSIFERRRATSTEACARDLAYNL